jgi:uncharacterized protein involved in exopolysaccharide biosynthesis
VTDGSGSGGRGPLASELDLLVGDVEQEGTLATAFLVGLTGKHAGKLFKVRLGESSIGRSSSSLVRLEERAASHVHAKLMLSSRGCFIVDLDSTNGTFVNGQRIDQPVELHAGDVVRCGTTNLGFLTDAEDDEQHTRAMARLTGSPLGLSAPRPGAMALRTSSTPSMGLARAPAGSEIYGGDARGAPIMVAPSPANPLQALDSLLDKASLTAQFLRRYWLLLLVCALLGGAAGALSILVKVPKSVATCEIVLRGIQNPNRRAVSDRLVDYFELADRNFVAPDLVRESVEEAHMPPSALSSVLYSLQFDAAGLGVFVASFSHVDARLAEDFLALHVKNFLERQIGRAISVVKSEADLLRGQYQENEDQLRAIEAKLRDFKQKHLDALPENAEGQLGTRGSLISQRDLLAAQLDRATQELALVRKQRDSGDAAATRSVAKAQPYASTLVTVRQDLAAARAQGFAETHPEIVRLKGLEARLVALQEQAMQESVSASEMRADATMQGLGVRIGQLEVLVSTTARELATVEGRLGSLSQIMGAMPEVEAGYAELMRKLEASQALHKKLHDQLKAKELQLEFERASVAARYEVMKQPRAFAVSRASTALKRGGLGIPVGLALGVLLAVLHWLRVYAVTRATRRA